MLKVHDLCGLEPPYGQSRARRQEPVPRGKGPRGTRSGVCAGPGLARNPNAAITKRFLERKVQEYDALKAEIEALKDELGDDAVPEKSPGA
jgi:hypothetical protein